MNNMLLFGALLGHQKSCSCVGFSPVKKTIRERLKVQPRSTLRVPYAGRTARTPRSAPDELQQQAAGQRHLPKPKGPSIVARVKKAVGTSTTKIHVLCRR